ncbi:MAG: MBOAT family protein [Bacteroidales bacterium]|nr:MBOAT family protein [Bacteroidales bacterium]
MLFNSFEFAIFLPITFILYWLVFNRNLKLQNAFIVAVSYLFYGWWDWRFLILIAFTTFCSYTSGILIDKANRKSQNKKAKIISATNITINLLILGVFKYYNFFVTSLADAFSAFGITLETTTLNIILPVGISFYTFQALSYSIDVYRHKIEATHDIIAFFAFVSFFPQLVAGPIERATNLLPQFTQKRSFDYGTAVDGCRQILWGLFKKIVVAGNCATTCNHIFATYTDQPASVLMVGALLFTFQIYGDFSGYSDIAIGTAKLFGIKLMRNFNMPYFSRDIAEFWRRWHISLTTWFRDYIYIPLGGSRVSKAKVVRNTLIIFLLSGLWHGANWTFVIWGAYHALLFLPLILLGKNRKYTHTIAEGKHFPSIKEFAMMLITFFLVVVGWIFFRAETIGDAWHYICGLCSLNIFKAPYLFFTSRKNFTFVIIMLAIEWWQRSKEHGLGELQTSLKRPISRYILYFFLFFSILAFQTSDSIQFLYFQF